MSRPRPRRPPYPATALAALAAVASRRRRCSTRCRAAWPSASRPGALGRSGAGEPFARRPRGLAGAGRRARRARSTVRLPSGERAAASFEATRRRPAGCSSAPSAAAELIDAGDLYFPASRGSRRAGRHAESLRDSGWRLLEDELVFVPLGGLGEIGMNAALYGFGPRGRRKWILVDCGMAFAGEEHMPGIDLMYPGPLLHRGARKNLLGIVITHAHEDHIGALAELWPRLRRAGLRDALRRRPPRDAPALRAGRAEDRDARGRARPALRARAVRDRVRAGRPLDPGIERARHPHAARPRRAYRRLEARRHAVSSAAPRTRRGSARSATRACWRSSAIRPTSCARAAARARARSRSASPNSSPTRRTASPSRPSPRTSRASAPSRRRPQACGREVVRRRPRHGPGRRGRARMRLSRRRARVPPARRLRLPAARQGRRAPDRLAGRAARRAGARRRRRASRRRAVAGRPGDLLVAHHPGQREGGRPHHQHARCAAASRSSPTAPISCMSPAIRAATSSPPCIAGRGRGSPSRPMARTCISPSTPPSRGRRACQEVVQARNGTVVRLAPGPAEIVDEVPFGRLYKDGDIVVGAAERAMPERRKLAFAGIVSVAIAIDERGEVAGDPVIEQSWACPPRRRRGEPIADLVADAVGRCSRRLPRGRRRDPGGGRAGGRARRPQHACQQVWGKKPAAMCSWSRYEAPVDGSSDRMIGRLNHVAIAVTDLEAASRVYRDTLGAEVSAPVPQPEHGVTVVFVTLPNTKIELLEPLGERLADPAASSSATRTAASITSATRSTISWPRATGWSRRAPACSARRAADRRPWQAGAVPAPEGLLRHAGRAGAGLIGIPPCASSERWRDRSRRPSRS